jgi:hypothetical protein
MGGSTATAATPNPAVYDPYSTTGGRATAGQQLNNLVANPSLAYSGPGFQATLQNGINASQAASAASGTLQSGGQNAALMNLGSTNFNNYYNQMFGQLGTLSGATSQTPSGAASAYQAGSVASATQQNAALMQSLGLGLGGANTALGAYNSGLFGSLGSSGGGLVTGNAAVDGYTATAGLTAGTTDAAGAAASDAALALFFM